MSPEGSVATSSMTRLLTFFPADGEVPALHPRDASCFLKEPNSRGSGTVSVATGKRPPGSSGEGLGGGAGNGRMFMGFFPGEKSLGPAEQEGEEQGRAGGRTRLLSVLRLCPLPYPFGVLFFHFPTPAGLGHRPAAGPGPSRPGAQSAGLSRGSARGLLVRRASLQSTGQPCPFQRNSP